MRNRMLTVADRQRARAEIERLNFSWEHWRCKRCRGNGVVEVHGTGRYDSDNDWVKCPEDPPEDQWGPSPPSFQGWIFMGRAVP